MRTMTRSLARSSQAKVKLLPTIESGIAMNTTPTSIATIVMHLPLMVVGEVSPYPTVVKVTIMNHSASKRSGNDSVDGMSPSRFESIVRFE